MAVRRNPCVKIRDTMCRFSDPAQDIRGRALVDGHGNRIGRITSLYVDTEKRTVSFLEVSAGAFREDPGPTIVVPVRNISHIRDDAVEVEAAAEWSGAGEMYRPEFVAGRPISVEVLAAPPPTQPGAPM